MNTRELYFSDFLAEKGMPLVKMEWPLLAEEFEAKAQGNSTKIPLLFDENDWKFLLQFPPKYWSKALWWRYNEGLLKASEERELRGLDDETLPEYMDEIVFMDGKMKITILPASNPECQAKCGESGVSENSEQPNSGIFTGFKTLFKKIENPVKISNYDKIKDNNVPNNCDDPNESKARIEARNQAMPPGPGIDQINPNDFAHPDYPDLKHRDEYQSGTVDGDLTEPNRISPEVLEQMGEKGKFPPHSFAGWKVISAQNASKALQRWIKGSSYIHNGQGEVEDPILPHKIETKRTAGGLQQHIVKDPLTGQSLPVQMISPKEMYHQWPGSVGKEDGVGYKHGDTQISARAHDIKIPAIKKQVCYKETPAKGQPRIVCSTVFMPVLGEGRALPNLTSEIGEGSYLKQKDVHLTREQKKAFVARKLKEQGKEDAGMEESGTPEYWGNIGGADNLYRIWDLLRPSQKKYMRENIKNKHHLAGYQHDIGYRQKWNPQNSTEENEDQDPQYRDIHSGPKFHYIVGGISPMEAQMPKGWMPSNPDIQDQIFKKYMWGSEGGVSIKDEATKGVELFINSLKKKIDLDKRPGSVNDEGEGVYGDVASLIGAIEYNKPEIIDVAMAILMVNLNTPLMGIHDPSLCLNVSPLEFQEMTHKNRINKAKGIATAMSQLSLETGTGSAIPTLARRKRDKAKIDGKWRAREKFKEIEGREPSNDEVTTFIIANPQYRPDNRLQNMDYGDENDADADSPIGSNTWSNPHARINATGEKTLARPHWLPVQFKGLAKYFNSLYEQIKVLKGKAAEFASKSFSTLEGKLEYSVKIYNTLYNRHLTKLTDSGIPASDPSKHKTAMANAAKELEVALQTKFPDLSPEEIANLSNKATKGSPQYYKFPKWFSDAMDDFAEDGVTEMEFPNEEVIPLSIKDIPINKGVLGVVEILAKLAKAVDDYADANDEAGETPSVRKQIIDTNETVNKYGFRLTKKCFPKMSEGNIIKQLTDLGYVPYETKFEPKAAVAPADTTTRMAPTVTPVSGNVAASNSAAQTNPIVSMLADPVKNYKAIVSHPEAVKHKSHVLAKLEEIRREFDAKRAAGGKISGAELHAHTALYLFANDIK